MKTDCQIKEERDAIIGDLNKECGNKFKLIGEERNKAVCWKFFSHVVEAETNKSTGYVAGKECHIVYCMFLPAHVIGICLNGIIISVLVFHLVCQSMLEWHCFYLSKDLFRSGL